MVDAVYVIAPESDLTLQKLLEKVALSGVNSLNCDVDAVKSVSNKMTNYEMLKKMGLKVPKTVLLEKNENMKKIKQSITKLGYPLVFKPIHGVSCDGLSVVKNDDYIKLAVKKIEQESISKKFIVQKLLRGKAASVCVLSTGDKALAVSLNKQLVTLASPTKKSRYHGGAVPFDHTLEKQALRTAEKVVKAIKGLKGYVGVDMILTKEAPVIIEVNPRLTVSYIGLSRAMNFNPAEAIVNSIIKGKLPKNVQNKKFVFFSKVEVPFVPKILAETYKIKDIISPPFPIGANKSSFALVASSASTIRGAQTAFCRAKKHLLSLYGGD
jgi:predicted ATP-grasp superfamily ATP-dependent carboligase